MSISTKQNIFVSYSHKDKAWLERLRVHLMPALRFGDLDLWDDTQIGAGDRWSGAIQSAIDRADIAILLVSADFLASDFITTHELPELLAAADARGTVVLIIHVGHSLQHHATRLGELQAINSPSTPLKALKEDEADQVLVRLAERVLEISRTKAQNQQKPTLGTSLPRHNLDFVGRTALVGEVKEALLARPSRIVILEGMGGIGKTTTGLAAAHDLIAQGYFGDGVLFINLEAFVENRRPKTSHEALDELVRSCSRQDVSLPNDPADLQVLWRDRTEGQKLLIFFDNAVDEDQIEPLLPGHADVSVLVTSRNKVDIEGAKHFELTELERTEGEQLALELGNKRYHARLTALDAGRLVKACGGLPLAIKVAANALSRSKGLSTKRFLAKLGERARAAAVLGAATNALRLSIEQLSAEDQNRWRQLGVLRGGFSRDAVAAIWQIDDPDELLAELERRSLIGYDDASDQYRLHDLLSSLAFNQLSEDPTQKLVAEERHARFFCKELHARAHLQAMAERPSTIELLAYFDINRLNIEAGQRWVVAQLKGRRPGDRDQVNSVSEKEKELWGLIADFGMSGIHMMISRHDDHYWTGWLIPWVRATRILDDRAHLEPFSLLKLSMALRWLGRIKFAKAVLILAEKLATHERSPTDHGILSDILSGLGSVHIALGNYEEALTVATRNRELRRQLSKELPEQRKNESWSAGQIGRALHHLEGAASALPYYEEHRKMAHDIGNLQAEQLASSYLGHAYMDLQRYEEASASFGRAVAIARTLGQGLQQKNLLARLAAAVWKQGDEAEALALMREEIGSSSGERNRTREELTDSLKDFCKKAGW